MKQSKRDSLMEALCNTAVGFVVSVITWRIVAYSLGIDHTWSQNVLITSIFTAVSLARSYLLRRAFNGRSVWVALKEATSK